MDVPAVDDSPAFTKLLGHGSIFAITLTDEETAKKAAKQLRPRPLRVYIPPAAPALTHNNDKEYDEPPFPQMATDDDEF